MSETMPIPVRFQDGEALNAAALNRLQEILLQQLLAHKHTGSDGAPLGSDGIAPGAIQSKHLGPIGLGPDQIAPGAVGATQLAEHVVAGHHLAAGAILTEALAASAVTLEKLASDVIAEIKKPRGATTYGWCAYLDPALLYPAPQGGQWFDWLLDANLPLPNPAVTLLDEGRPLPFLMGATLDASPPVKPKGPPVEPVFRGVDPGPKPAQPTFSATPPNPPPYGRPTEPQRLPDSPYQPPGAPGQPGTPEIGEPAPNGETQEVIRILHLPAADLKRQLDDPNVSDQTIALSFQRALAVRVRPKGPFGKKGFDFDDSIDNYEERVNELVQGLLNYRADRRRYWAIKAQWDQYRVARQAYEAALAQYNNAYEAAKAKLRGEYDQAYGRYREQADAWKRYDQAFESFKGGQNAYQQALEAYQMELKAWEERSAKFHQAEGEYRAKREEYEQKKAEYDKALAKYQTEKENFVARIQPAPGFPVGDLVTQRFALQVDPAKIGWAVSPVGEQHLRPTLVTNEPFTSDAKPATITPGQKLDEAGRALIARIAYAFGLPEEVDPVQRMSARLHQFLNTPGLLLGGYLGELRNVRSIARMHEGGNAFVRVRFERPYPTATYTVSVTPDGRPGAPVPQPFVWRQTPTYVDLCFQAGNSLVNTLAFRFAIHGELSES